ncbi:MAG: MarR family transcriptional regulator [Candidatus Omnitrophica bacterium]|nr:MarR family transcriptional regulator [Candidatus Omnitrophota bacterium]
MPFISLNEFADRINAIMPMLMREFSHKQPEEIYKGKATLPQILILEFLSSQGQVKMKDIAVFMKVSTSATTGIVDRLVKSGYAIRVSDQKDRRIVKTMITPKGLFLMKKLTNERRRMVIDIFGKLSEQDRKDYLRVLTRIKSIFSGG